MHSFGKLKAKLKLGKSNRKQKGSDSPVISSSASASTSTLDTPSGSGPPRGTSGVGQPVSHEASVEVLVASPLLGFSDETSGTSVGRTILHGARNTLEAVNQAADVFPPLKSTLGGVAAILKTYDVSKLCSLYRWRCILTRRFSASQRKQDQVRIRVTSTGVPSTAGPG